MDQRLESPPANGFVADPSQNLSPIQAYMDQRLESLQDMDCLSLIQKDSGTGSIFIPHRSQKY